jgi:hypothetical protein
MATFNSKKFDKDIAASLRGKAIKEKAYLVAKQRAERAHKEMMEEFDAHPVTQEIVAGDNAANLSGTLGGYGNLYTFIGFHQGTRPTSPIRDYLKETGKIFREPRTIKQVRSVEFRFKLNTPRQKIIENLTPSPWEGRSWTRGIERGITGLGHYMYSQNNPASRSGSGIQKSNKLRTMAFRPVQYMTSILENFYKKTK